MVLHGTSSDDLDRMYTLGCFGIRHSEWPKFKQDLAAYKAAHGGQSPYINIAPDRTLTITDKPTWGAQVHGVQQAINKLTPNGPKIGSQASRGANRRERAAAHRARLFQTRADANRASPSRAVKGATAAPLRAPGR
jgi:hypothetical protein